MPDLIDPEPFSGLAIELLSGLLLTSASLLTLRNEDEARANDLLFRLKLAIFRNPLRNPEYLFFSMSDKMDGRTELASGVADRVDKLVPGLCSLDAHEVGAVDCDVTELWFVGSEAIVVADKDELMASRLVVIWEGNKPSSRASWASVSSTSSSVVPGRSLRTVP